MKKRLYVDFHVLQTVPPSCINRDDTGSPKTAMYGGVLRARVSSQAWKHAMRKDFAENTPLDVGKRTKKAAELVKEQILALDPEQKKADKMAKDALKHVNITSNDKKGTDALVFISSAQAKALAELAVEGCTNDEKYEEAMIKNPSADMVLFGRMVAQKASLNYDAAAQVAHSISTHAVKNEYDYFTAVDDCQTDSTGAGHLGTVEYNSSTLYRYATVNVLELAGQLGAEQAAETVRAFGEAHPAGCGVCDHPGRSAGEPVRRIRACGVPRRAGRLCRGFQGCAGPVCAAGVCQLCRGSGPELYCGRRAGSTGSGTDGKSHAGRAGKGCPGCAVRK